MNIPLCRRDLLKLTLSGVSASLLPRIGVAQNPQAKVKTFTYKKVGTLEIKADVHRADDNKTRPVLVWIHGGALINGHRAGVSRRMLDMFLGAGYAVVSIDYRLAPETHLPKIIEDLEDAFGWVRKKGPELFNVATDKIAVSGGSAGGCLTLTAGFRVKPRPTVLVPFWGYGDLVGDWLSKPSPHARHHNSKLTDAEAEKIASGPVVSDSRNRKANGGAFYQYCRQRGIWPREVSGGWDPINEPDKFHPYMAVKNVTKDYPPTLLIHGTEDTDVPHEQSEMMAEQFEKHGVEHRLISVPGGEHGLAGADPKLVNKAYQAAFDFIQKHMASSDLE